MRTLIYSLKSLLPMNFVMIVAITCFAVPTAESSAQLPDADLSQYDSQFVRFHGRGDVLTTADFQTSCNAFSTGIYDDQGEDLHARLRIRLAPESEYKILDQTAPNAKHATGRILWTQGGVGYAYQAGFTIAYRHDTDELYFALGDAEGGVINSRVWKVSVTLDDGVFRTIDWGYNELIGEAGCWIDGVAQTVTQVTKNGGALQDPPTLVGSWIVGGSLMGNPGIDAMSVLAGTGTSGGWGNDIGQLGTVWPDTDTNYNDMRQNTSAVGDVSYAAFRWARPTHALTVTGADWDVELKLEGGPSVVDSKGGLNTQDLISGGHDSLTPAWCDTAIGQKITSWIPTLVETSGHPQIRQLMIYHHGLGDQNITLTEQADLPPNRQLIDEWLVCGIGPDADIVYWAIQPKGYTDYESIVGQAPANDKHTIVLPAGKPGLYRIIIKTPKFQGYLFETNQGITYAPDTVPNPDAVYWGAYAPFSNLEGIDGFPATDVYAYIPKSSEKFDLRFQNITNAYEVPFAGSPIAFDDNWNPQSGFTSGGALFSTTPELLEMDLGTDWFIEARRFPFVLSNSRFAAEHYVRGGVTEMPAVGSNPAFTLWSPDEKRLHDHISKLVATQNVGVPSSLYQNFSAQKSHILANPLKYYTLATYPRSLRSIHTAINYQNTDPTSGMVGAIDHDPTDSNQIHRYADKANSLENFDMFGTSMMFWAGWPDTDANPYYAAGAGDPFEIRARCAMLSYARHVQGTRLRNSVTDNGLHHGNAGLAGSDVFGDGLHWGRVYGLLTADDRAAILPAVVIELCHILNTNPTSTRNQDAHFFTFLYEAGQLWARENSNDQTVLNLAREYAERIVIPFHPNEQVAMGEATGFDGSYSGMQNYMLAAGWLVSGYKSFDPDVTGNNYGRQWGFLDTALDTQYGFWSRYMAPSPDKERIAFAHDSDSRTAMGAVREQFEGAKVIGSRLNPIAARLLFTDGSSLATELLLDPNQQNLSDSLAQEIDKVIADLSNPNNPVEAPNWEIFDSNNNPKPGARSGTKFDLMGLYSGGFEHMFDNGAPIISTEEIPAEEVITSNNIVIDEIDDAYITVNTPNYYAVFPTRALGSYYYQQEAFDIYQYERDIEDASNPMGGGDHESEEHVATKNSNKPAYRGEEIGGVGLSLFYDKTISSPVIVGRNFSPLTTHQLVGYTAGIQEARRWANQRVREFHTDFDADPPSMTIKYWLNSSGDHDDSLRPYDETNPVYLGDDLYTGYRVEREFVFYPDRIRVNLKVQNPLIGNLEPLDRLYETLPFEMNRIAVGDTIRDSRQSSLEQLTLPWSGLNNVWDQWCATDWLAYQATQPPAESVVGLQYRGQEITWIQKSIPLPSIEDPDPEFNYDIAVSSPSPLPAAGGDGSPDYNIVLKFIRAYERGDPSADLDNDGTLTENDLRLILQGDWSGQ